MPPESGGICGKLNQDLTSTRLQGGHQDLPQGCLQGNPGVTLEVGNPGGNPGANPPRGGRPGGNPRVTSRDTCRRVRGGVPVLRAVLPRSVHPDESSS